MTLCELCVVERRESSLECQGVVWERQVISSPHPIYPRPHRSISRQRVHPWGREEECDDGGVVEVGRTVQQGAAVLTQRRERKW